MKINEGAYQGRTELIDIVIPAGVMEIGESAFAGGTGLISVNIPASVKSVIPKNAFERKTKIIWSEEDRSAKYKAGNRHYHICPAVLPARCDGN